MENGRTKVIACATVIEEMLPLMPVDLAYEVLDFGLHLVPGSLKARLQEAIDAACAEEYDTVILGYGLCSMAVVGLETRTCTVVIPRVDDCIACFLGSRDAYTAQNKKEPGVLQGSGFSVEERVSVSPRIRVAVSGLAFIGLCRGSKHYI